MSVLILKNFPSEGPGTIGDFLDQNNLAQTTVDLMRDFPDDTDGYDALVMLGGPMSVNDEDKYPYLREEMKLAERFMKSGKKVFGICLGAQLMAKALGAKVYPGREKEIGWHDIELKDAGLSDPLMDGLSADGKRCRVFQWHGETFDIPKGAERLASSDLYPNQAFRYGENAYAFQFHIEVTRDMIIDWMENESVDMVKLKQDTEAYYSEYASRANRFYKSFFN